MEKYELDWTRSEDNGHHEIIAILTGLPIEEIEAVSPKRDAWYGRDFIEIFRKLGFNVNPRYIKFRPETEYPCMMRFRDKTDKKVCWYSWVYYDDIVYCGGGERWTLDDWIKASPNCRVTSMLQVWI